jgi:glycerophosphoryl diester phosphodiesterase
MAAYRKARDLGSPGIELDIHLSAGGGGSPGELVVVHDDTFIRTAPAGANGGGRKIEEIPIDEIRSIDVGSFVGPAFSGERPPLLADVLREFCPAMYVDIELKTRKTRDDPLPLLAAEMLARLGPEIESAVTVSSFNPFSLRAFKKANPRVATTVIWCADPEVPWILRRGFGRIIAGCDYLKPIHLQVNRFSRFRHTVLEGRPVVPWTVDDPETAARMFRAGSEGIITNRPQDLLPAFGAAFHG